jgi:hypothetical protein
MCIHRSPSWSIRLFSHTDHETAVLGIAETFPSKSSMTSTIIHYLDYSLMPKVFVVDHDLTIDDYLALSKRVYL